MKKVYVLLVVMITVLGGYWFWEFVTQDWRGNDNLKYINAKHDYSFQYSPDWNLTGDPQSDIVMLYNTENLPGDGGLPAGVQVDVMIVENYLDDLSLEEWIEQLSQREPEVEVLMEENVSIDGMNAVRRTVSPIFADLNESAPVSIYFIKEGNVVIISYLGREPDYSSQLGNFELILKTFHFN